MKKLKGFAIVGVIVAVIVCLVNWDYVNKLVDLERRAISDMFTGSSGASRALNRELEDLSVSKFINPKLLALLPDGDGIPELPEPVIDPTTAPTSAPKDRPYDEIDPDELRDLLKTDPDTAFFWSGTTTDNVNKQHGGEKDAAKIARKRGGVTLEMKLEEGGVIMPEWDKDDPASVLAWDTVSAMFAEQATGDVWAVVGQDLRIDSSWENVEYDRLTKNPEITGITLIEPWTLEEKILYDGD